MFLVTMLLQIGTLFGPLIAIDPSVSIDELARIINVIYVLYAADGKMVLLRTKYQYR